MFPCKFLKSVNRMCGTLMASLLAAGMLPLSHGFEIGSLGVASVPLARSRGLQATLDESARARIEREADGFFRSIDDNGDGYISFTELSDHLSGLGLGKGAQEHVFDLLDVNRDGEISQSELLESFVKYDDPALRAALGLGETESDVVFRSIDANGDGKISHAELSAYLIANGYSAEIADTVFATLDENSDGAVSRDELHEGYSSYSALRRILALTSHEA